MKANNLNKSVTFRMTDEEHTSLKRIAKNSKQSLSSLLREILKGFLK